MSEQAVPSADKSGPTSDPGHPQPTATEVESARQLENAVAPRLEAEGISRDESRRLADEYIALDIGGDPEDFVSWVRDRRT
jgi:hypothetical protein